MEFRRQKSVEKRKELTTASLDRQTTDAVKARALASTHGFCAALVSIGSRRTFPARRSAYTSQPWSSTTSPGPAQQPFLD